MNKMKECDDLKQPGTWMCRILILCTLFLGCNRQAQITDGEAEFYTIDFGQCIKTERPMLMSEIADTVEYLELKTPYDIIISKIGKVIIWEDYIIIKVTYKDIYLFQRNGQFVRKIGSMGQGPGEYTGINDIVVSPSKKEIIVAAFGSQLLFYDLEGNYLYKKEWGSFFSMGISDSTLWCGNLSDNTEKFLAFAVSLNGDGDTIASIYNRHFGVKSMNSTRRIATSRIIDLFYDNDGTLFFRGLESNDTIWKLSGTMTAPYAFIDMGKYKLPVEYEPWYSMDAFKQFGSGYWSIPSVAEDERYFYLHSVERGLSDNQVKCIVYDKKARKGFVAKNKDEVAITDDILGGPSIWPRWITDEYYINVVEGYDLLEELEEGDFSPSEPFKKQLAGIGEDTNQLIILCHRKKK